MDEKKNITLDLEIGNSGIEMTEDASKAISDLLSTSFVIDTILKCVSINIAYICTV
jgi:hypothetical protein